jgi:hypothetical protein
LCDNLQKSLLVVFSSLGVLGVDQQLLLEGKRLPLSDEESLPLEKNRYTCFVAPADKSSSYEAKGGRECEWK